MLFTVGSLDGGGAERRLVELLRHIDRNRIAPVLHLMERRGPLLGQVPNDVPIISWRSPGQRQSLLWRALGRIWPDWTRSLFLWRQLRQQPVDVVVGWLLQSAHHAVLPCRWLRVPLVACSVSDRPTEIAAAFPECPTDEGCRRAHAIFQAATRVLANSADLRRQLIVDNDLPPEKVLFSPSLRDFELLDAAASESQPIWPNNGRRLLAIGRLDRNKGYHDLLSAVARLRNSAAAPFSLLIVGDGPERDHLQQQIQELHLEDVVRLKGHVPTAAPYLRATDMLLLTSYHEGFPNVLLEALALGVPVVSTDCPAGPREILQDGRWGRLTAVGDPSALASAIAETLSNLAQAREVARTASTVIRDRHDIRAGVRRFEDMLCEVADEYRRNPRRMSSAHYRRPVVSTASSSAQLSTLNSQPSTPPSTRRLRVLCYIGALDAGGAERQVVEILRHLDRSRFEPLLLLAHRRGALLGEVPEDVPIFLATPDPPPRLPGMTRWKRIRRFASILREQQIDVVYDRTYLATLDAACACCLRPTPRISAAVADPRVQFEMYAKRPRWLWRRCSRWAYRSADNVLANSAGLRQQLMDFWQLSPDRILVQPNAFDFEHIDRLAAEPSARATDGRTVILTVGRIDLDKGHRDLLEALRLLVRERGQTSLVWKIVGTGPDAVGLQTAASTAGLSAHVEFLGESSNPFPEYRAADLFCLPSRTEGLPNVLIEALACGTPVLSTDCHSGPREILAGGDFGRLVPVRDPMALADAIEDFCRHREAWQHQARIGAAAIRQRYAAAVVIRNLETMLEAVATRASS